MKTFRIFSRIPLTKRLPSNVFNPTLFTKRFFTTPSFVPNEKVLKCMHEIQDKGIVVRNQIMDTFFRLNTAFNDPNNRTTLTYLTGVDG